MERGLTRLTLAGWFLAILAVAGCVVAAGLIGGWIYALIAGTGQRAWLFLWVVGAIPAVLAGAAVFCGGQWVLGRLGLAAWRPDEPPGPPPDVIRLRFENGGERAMHLQIEPSADLHTLAPSESLDIECDAAIACPEIEVVDSGDTRIVTLPHHDAYWVVRDGRREGPFDLTA